MVGQKKKKKGNKYKDRKGKKLYVYSITDNSASLRKFVNKLFISNKEDYHLQYTGKMYTFISATTIKTMKKTQF